MHKREQILFEKYQNNPESVSLSHYVILPKLQEQMFYSHFTVQTVKAGNFPTSLGSGGCEMQQNFFTAYVPLLMATGTFGLGNNAR